MSDIHVIHSTFSSSEAAESAARRMVNNGLVACVNLGSPMTSIYSWEGDVQEETEIPFLAKTSTAQLDDAVADLRDNHPYDCPEILVMSVDEASNDYETWVHRMTGSD